MRISDWSSDVCSSDLEREVDLEELLVVAALLVRHDVVHQRMDLLVDQRRDVDAAHVAVDADRRRRARRQMQVRCLVLDHERKQLGDIHACSTGAATGMNNPYAEVEPRIRDRNQAPPGRPRMYTQTPSPTPP